MIKILMLMKKIPAMGILLVSIRIFVIDIAVILIANGANGSTA